MHSNKAKLYQSRTQRPLAPTPTAAPNAPNVPMVDPPSAYRVHSGAVRPVSMSMPVAVDSTLFHWASKPTPMPFAAMTAQHRIQSPHVQILQLGDTPILTKAALDPRFLIFWKLAVVVHMGPLGSGNTVVAATSVRSCGVQTIQPIWAVRSPRRCKCQTGAHRMWCCAAHSSPRGRTTGARAFVVGGPTGRNPSAPEPLDLGWKSTSRPCHAFDHKRNQAPRAVAVCSVGPHAQIPKRPTRHACQRRPTGLFHFDVGVSRPPPIDRRHFVQQLDRPLLNPLTKRWAAGQKMNHTTEGITAIHHAARTHDHLRLCDGKRIQSSCILEVARTIDGVVHAHVNHQQHAIGLKAA